jgi:hypothetical protein
MGRRLIAICSRSGGSYAVFAHGRQQSAGDQCRSLGSGQIAGAGRGADSIRHCQDWSGDEAIFFRILLSDEASQMRLHEVTRQVSGRLDELVDFRSMGLFSYYNFRSVSEQDALREEAWA